MNAFVSSFTDSRLSSDVLNEINNLCTTGDASHYGMVSSADAQILADAAALVNATANEIYTLYRLSGDYCVEYEGFGAAARYDDEPCLRRMRPHYEMTNWFERNITAAELAAIYIARNRREYAY